MWIQHFPEVQGVAQGGWLGVDERYGGAGARGKGKGTTPHTPKYLDQFLTVLLATFITGLIFARQSKEGIATLCLTS